MSYAIVSISGKQYRVREGQHLVVDRVPFADGDTFTPDVLLFGGSGDVAIAPDDVEVTARVVEHQRGPKIRIGKFRKRTGYRRHTGFRAALTKVQIESIGGPATGKKATKPEPASKAVGEKAPVKAEGAVPEGYGDLTVAQIRDAAPSWELDELNAALVFEHAHAARKGAVAALESAIAGKEGD